MTSEEVRARIIGFYKGRSDKAARVLDALQNGDLPPEAGYMPIGKAYDVLMRLDIEKTLLGRVEEMKLL